MTGTSPVDAVFLNGTTGVGKTTALQALGSVLIDRGVPHALIDLDMIRLGWPAPRDDPFNRELELANLRLIAPNFRQVGAEALAVAGVLGDRYDVDRFRQALGAERILLCRLSADPAEVEARLRSRHRSQAPDELAGFLRGHVALAELLDAADLDDVVIDVGALTPREVAERVADAAGWLAR